MVSERKCEVFKAGVQRVKQKLHETFVHSSFTVQYWNTHEEKVRFFLVVCAAASASAVAPRRRIHKKITGSEKSTIIMAPETKENHSIVSLDVQCVSESASLRKIVDFVHENNFPNQNPIMCNEA